jgi:N-acetyl-anhydromuramyl-L-alanine amidase AmpD
VIIHVTDGHGSAEGTAGMFATPRELRIPAVGTSAHFVVGQAGEVVQSVDLGDVANHCHSVNQVSVGIEHCARTPGEFGIHDPGLPLADAQYKASALLVAWLCRVAGLPIDRAHIQGHAEADPVTTHRKCPLGAGWSWEKFMPMVEQAAKEWADIAV